MVPASLVRSPYTVRQLYRSYGSAEYNIWERQGSFSLHRTIVLLLQSYWGVGLPFNGQAKSSPVSLLIASGPVPAPSPAPAPASAHASAPASSPACTLHYNNAYRSHVWRLLA